MAPTPRLILFHKPYRVLSERTGEPGKPTVADYVPVAGLDPAGRLDYDSEGLVVLTDLGWLQHLIIHPRHKLPKTYWVQVEGTPSPEALRHAREGMALADGPTRPAEVEEMATPPVWPRDPPVQVRADRPPCWLRMVLTEGRKRQIRRMTAALGHPTLRLIRVAVGPWELGPLQPGQWRECHCPGDEKEFRRLAASPPA